ncbi:ABC transporter ATP-binding protein [uncultured Intestinibacter sp.]|uniref:ABC transporter ATP-binding protein n=1 Tax=Intestinibacter sp. TaxID=1965304 RepID=UPI0027DB2499|nr:ABC transporter ATP-binding protein [uncultured Intestinibacter sp.]
MRLNNKIIEVRQLQKSYKDVKAVNGIDFYVEKGELFAFLGLNGAGKSTTIDMLCTFLKADRGSIKINNYEVGKDDEKIKSLVGVVFQESVLDELLTVKENLITRSKLYNMSKDEFNKNLEEIADITGIREIINRQYRKLSGGQRRRVDIARALINKPKILFLDEPTTGLDPKTRKNVWDMIRTLQKDNNMTVFLTTHYMEEASKADYIVVMDKGVIAAKGTTDELKEKYAKDKMIIYFDDEKSDFIENYLKENNYEFFIQNNDITIEINTTLDSIKIIDDCRIYINSFEVIKGSMDDVFLNITKGDK